MADFWMAVAMPYLVPIVLVALFIYYVTKGVAQAVSGQKISEINGVEVDKEKINSIQKKLKKGWVNNGRISIYTR